MRYQGWYNKTKKIQFILNALYESLIIYWLNLLMSFYFQCTLREDGTWTPCTKQNAECKCYHESGSNVGLCLSTAYTDFNQFGEPNDSDVNAATPRHPDISSH